MIDNDCILDIHNNKNTGVEYELALFYSLCKKLKIVNDDFISALEDRADWDKIHAIIQYCNPNNIIAELSSRKLKLYDVSLETQNDDIGPADIVLHCNDAHNSEVSIGLSVKYANTCTLNVTGRRFISDSQVNALRNVLKRFTKKYISEMNSKFGSVDNWFRKRKKSKYTDKFIDLVRDAVISNWPNISNKKELFSALYHADSPIEFWVVTFNGRNLKLDVNPVSVDYNRVDDITVSKFHKAYVAFNLDGVRIGHMQVKFNNGFIEKCRGERPEFIEQGVPMCYGKPFSSWNFCVEKSSDECE